ncbi:MULTISPECIES: hypothetical protein [Providencia]|uniref:hypothetical protein n=2 Tax=Morganellaceae TaxID=1903414 RepID=UPI00197EAD26|nr:MULTISPECIES: hypothetical protein [Providencia]MBN4866955.1 hypothetical protein [Providencia stuartii]MBN4876141.1 hypothetical protein [Providencia stuartii]MBN4880969.1 hypothetical protein [Providencia stuartii]MBN4885477.1 hypothetical protein [Providencia stuartii]HEM8294794.1 hypothetical protein [Providencia stuartii]
MMSYEFIIENELPQSVAFPYQSQNSAAPGTFLMSEDAVSAMMSILQIMDKLDTDESLDEHCFNQIWLKSELTPARAEEIYLFLEERLAVEPLPSQEEIAAFHQAQVDENKLLSQESSKEGMIPVHKFSTNDGWLVTTKECEWIAEVFAPELVSENHFVVSQISELCKISHQKLEHLLIEWGKFNLFASKHGGYRVN